MNLVVIGVLSSVVLLAGCTQNESRRPQNPANAAAEPARDPVTADPAAKTRALPPDVNVADRDFQTRFQDRAVVTSGSTDVVIPTGTTDLQVPAGTLNVAIPAMTAPKIEDPSTMAGTGVTEPPRLQIQPSRPVEITDASPDFPAGAKRPGVTAATAATATPAVTAPTSVTGTFKPVPAPSVDDEMQAEASPVASSGQTHVRGQEQRFRPMPKAEDRVETAPTGPSRLQVKVENAPTGVTRLEGATGPAKLTAGTTTVVVVAVSGATGPTGPTGKTVKDQKPLVAATTAVTTDALTKKFDLKDVDVVKSKAYTTHLQPLIEKIRKLNATTASRLEKKIKELKLRTYQGADEDIWNEFKNDTLVSGFRLPGKTDFRLVQLKSSVLIPATEMSKDDVAARWILEAALFRLAFDSTSKKDLQFMSSVTGLAHAIADSFLKNRERLNQRTVYEYLRYAQVAVDEWSFPELDAMAVSTAILKLSLRDYTVTMAQPENAFDVRPLDLTNPKDENCKVNITYHGIEKGVLVQVSEPKWREFEFTFDVQSKEKFPLRPSMAGDQYQDLEIIKKQADKTSLRLTVRFLAPKAGSNDERVADHMVLEKLPEKGKAEKVLMCRIVPWDTTPPKARPADEDKDAVTAPSGVTATTGPVRGQEQRFRPMPAATGVTGAKASTGVTASTAATSAIRGQEQRFRPMPAATGITGAKASTGVTAATAATSAIRGQEQRFRPMPAATGITGVTGVSGAKAKSTTR